MSRITSAVAALATAAAITGGSVVAAAPASAATSGCTPVSGGQAYLSPWGDTNTYVLAPGGSFSASPSPWTLRSSWLDTYDNTPSNVTGDPRRGSLAIGFGGSATSPSTCVRWMDDRIRFFYKAPAGTSFKVTTTVTSGIGTGTYNTWITSSRSEWQLSPAVLVPDWSDETGTMQVKVTVANPMGSTIKIDDVLVDPWRTTRW